MHSFDFCQELQLVNWYFDIYWDTQNCLISASFTDTLIYTSLPELPPTSDTLICQVPIYTNSIISTSIHAPPFDRFLILKPICQYSILVRSWDQILQMQGISISREGPFICIFWYKEAIIRIMYEAKTSFSKSPSQLGNWSPLTVLHQH